MRAIGTTLWVSAVLFELAGCGPRVSVGDLGAGGANDGASSGSGGAASSAAGSSAAGSSQAGSNQGEGGSKVTGGGGTAVNQGGETNVSAGGEAVAEGGADPVGPDQPATGCTMLGEKLPPVAIACPDALPESGDPCDDVAENGVCVWQTGIVGQGNVGYEIRGCYSAVGGKQWYGVGQGALGPVGVDPQHCPKTLPEAGSSCSGHDGENCYFPEAACACAGAVNGNWQCTENAKPNLVPRPFERLCVPEGLDEATAIKDLTNGEITRWCTWYAGAGPRPPLSGVDAPGYANSYSTSFGHIGGHVCVMDLPLELCVKNVKAYGSECTATLEQLDDCVESIRAWGNADPAWVGHGCGPLMSNESCAHVVVQALADNAAPSDCKVPVE